MNADIKFTRISHIATTDTRKQFEIWRKLTIAQVASYGELDLIPISDLSIPFYIVLAFSYVFNIVWVLPYSQTITRNNALEFLHICDTIIPIQFSNEGVGI